MAGDPVSSSIRRSPPARRPGTPGRRGAGGVGHMIVALGALMSFAMALGTVPASAVASGAAFPPSPPALTGSAQTPLDQAPPALVEAVRGAKLRASDGAAYDWFGISVAVSGDTAVVGALGDDTP